MKALCIVPCGKTKIWDKNNKAGPTTARDAYIGSFAKKCREYAERFFPDSYLILSAKYGFLFPDEIIAGPYNTSFNDRKSNPISMDELVIQAADKGLLKYNRVFVIGGRNYVGKASELFTGAEIINPLKGCKGNGYMMQRLCRLIKAGNPRANND
jgi:hypothetical protein